MDAKKAVIYFAIIMLVFAGLFYLMLQEFNVGDSTVCGDGSCGTGENADNCPADCQASRVGKPYGRWDVEFDAISLAGGTNAQDAEADLDIDIFVWDASKNDDLVDEGWIDCSMVQEGDEAYFDGDNIVIEVPESAYCDINVYKFWRDSNFVAGDSENQINKYLQSVVSDIDDIGGSTTEGTLNADRTYLVTLTEGAAATISDVVPQAFLIKSSKYTNLDPEEFAAGNINTKFETKYYSSAYNHSKVSLSGDCEDDEENSPSLDSSLDGAIHSSLTTATTIKLDCEITQEIDRDGYAIILENPIAEISSEAPYWKVNIYLENGTAGTWSWYGNSTYALTGDIKYSADDDDTNAQVLQEETSFCGVILSDDSGTDALVNADEKLYPKDMADCYDDVVVRKMGAYGIFDEDAQLVTTIKISELKVDYDEPAAANDELVSGAGGGTGEDIIDVSFFTMEATNDKVAQQITG